MNWKIKYSRNWLLKVCFIDLCKIVLIVLYNKKKKGFFLLKKGSFLNKIKITFY